MINKQKNLSIINNVGKFETSCLYYNAELLGICAVSTEQKTRHVYLQIIASYISNKK